MLSDLVLNGRFSASQISYVDCSVWCRKSKIWYPFLGACRQWSWIMDVIYVPGKSGLKSLHLVAGLVECNLSSICWFCAGVQQPTPTPTTQTPEPAAGPATAPEPAPVSGPAPVPAPAPTPTTNPTTSGECIFFSSRGYGNSQHFISCFECIRALF